MRFSLSTILAALTLAAPGGPTASTASSAPSVPPARRVPRVDGVPGNAPGNPERPTKIVEYTLQAKLDPAAHTVAGTGTLRWTNTSSVATSELWFHLYLNAFKNQRSVFLREPLGSGRGGAPVTDWGTIDVRRLFWREANAELWGGVELHRPNDEDETDARVPLPRPVLPGETITLEMTWDDKLPSVVERTGYSGSFHFVAQWFPKIARLDPDGTWAHFPFHRLSEFYADFGNYDVTLDVPQGFVVGATGQVTEQRVDGARRIERHVQNDVHDFAWTAWDKFRVYEGNVGRVFVRSLYPPGYDKVAARAFDTAARSLQYFGERYGEYPYPILTVVHPPEGAREAGGMEYPTLITTGGSWWMPEGLRSIQAVTVHEFGHQYFYGLLASNENRWPFLDEGLNTYAEHDATSAFYGAGAEADLFGLTIDGPAISAAFSDSTSQVVAVGAAAPQFPSFDSYGRLVYLRTGAILQTLGRVYGREALASSLGQYTRLYRFNHPQPEDLFHHISRDLGDGAGENLRRAVMDRGWVDYEVLDISTRSSQAAGIFDRDGKRETVQRVPSVRGGPVDTSILVARRGTLRFPVDVAVTFENGTVQHFSWDTTEATHRFDVRADAPVRTVHIDPDRKVLLDRNPRNNFKLGPDGSSSSTKMSLERILYWAQRVLDMVLP